MNNTYLRLNDLNVSVMGRGFTWLDAGNPDALLEASNYVRTLQRRQGLQIACLEEIALRNNWKNKKVIEFNAS